MSNQPLGLQPGQVVGHWTIVGPAATPPGRGRRYVVRAACDDHEVTVYGYNLLQNAHRTNCNNCRPARPTWTPEERAARAAATTERRAAQPATWTRCGACAGLVLDTAAKRTQHVEDVHDGNEVTFGEPIADTRDDEEAA